MSLEAYIWAANLPLDRSNGTSFRVLLQLADRADPLGRGAYPGVGKIAETLQCDERTVYRALAKLRRDGLIRTGDQRFVDHLDPRYRPTVYDVLTTALVQMESSTGNRVTPTDSRGDKSGRPGVTTGVSRTVHEPTYQDSPRHHLLVTARVGEGQ
nr:helix-turn-helix domain-containing protein [Microbacterium bovistercoris]